MPNSRRLSASKKTPAQRPLVFISHDSRDADLAEAFSKLLADSSGGVLQSFRSSDRKGFQGIEYGNEWYPTLKSKLKHASDVVCLLTQRSFDRPWLLYEAGFARGKPNTPVYGVALGIPVDRLSAGPFAQFQNCGDDQESLTKLLAQLVTCRVHNSQPNPEIIGSLVRSFKDCASKVLEKISESETPPPALPASLQKLADNWKRHIQSHPNEPNPERFKLYTLCGITDTQGSDQSSPDADLEDVYFLWADAGAGSSIKAKVIREGGKRTEIRFDNAEGSHPSNVAFRIKGRNLVYQECGFRMLKFLAKIPANVRSGELREVQLGIRIVDALKTHWMYSYLEGYKPLCVGKTEPKEWQEFKVDLSGGNWQVFKTDGNALYHDERPDFSMILAVIVEVGKRNALRPGSGKGVLELKDFAVE